MDNYEERTTKTQMTMGAKIAKLTKMSGRTRSTKSSGSDNMVETKKIYNWPNIAKTSKNGPQQHISKIVSIIGNI